MKQATTTDEVLIRYLYDETSLDDRKEIEHEIIHNKKLSDMHKQLNDIRHQLPKVLLEPPKSVIQNILDYSKKSTSE